jgi:signal transduction histidine kinase
MEKRSLLMTQTLPADPIWLWADAGRISQILANLLGNAAKYSTPGGAIALSVAREGREVTVRIRDTGIGIAPEIVPQLFQLYAQVDPTCSRSEAGLGIGLALVRSLVEAHGGRISVKSAGLGYGSEFTIRLPVDDQGCAPVALLPALGLSRNYTSDFRVLRDRSVDPDVEELRSAA